MNTFQSYKYINTSKATKVRIEKNGKHKLGPGGYSNLAAQYVSIAKPKSASKYHTDCYFCFVLEKNVKLMTSCKYEADRFKELLSPYYMKLGFERGFDVVVEHQRSLSGHTARSYVDPSGDQVCKNCIV